MRSSVPPVVPESFSQLVEGVNINWLVMIRVPKNKGEEGLIHFVPC